MFFKKNKISQGIDNSANSKTVSNDFESLDAVSQKKKQRSLFYRLFVKQYHDGKENIKEKKVAIKKYFKTNWFKLVQSSMILLLIVSFIMTLCILFQPFSVIQFAEGTGLTNGNVYTPLNNIYTALQDQRTIYGLTPLGIVYTVINVILCGLFITWVLVKRKQQSPFLCLKSKDTKIISITAYVLIGLAFLTVLIIAYIPPIPSSSLSDGLTIKLLKNSIDGYMNNNSNSRFTEEEITGFIVQLSNYSDNPLSSGVSYGDAYKWYNSNQGEIWPTNHDNVSNNLYAFYQDISSPISVINAAGYSLLSISAVFFIVGLCILPFTNEIIKAKEEIKQSMAKADLDLDSMKANMNSFKLMIVKFLTKLNTKFFTKLNNWKNRDSFRKYKKEMSQTGMTASQQLDSFKSDVVENTVSNVITKEEIEKHEPNKAFLNSQGQYMYHDGNHNYFIVKNDEWVPFNIEEGVHQAQVHIKSSRDTDLSNKKVKERKWFKGNRAVEKLSEKVNKDKAAIDLPDEELNKIISELDI